MWLHRTISVMPTVIWICRRFNRRILLCNRVLLSRRSHLSVTLRWVVAPSWNYRSTTMWLSSWRGILVRASSINRLLWFRITSWKLIPCLKVIRAPLRWILSTQKWICFWMSCWFSTILSSRSIRMPALWHRSVLKSSRSLRFLIRVELGTQMAPSLTQLRSV